MNFMFNQQVKTPLGVGVFEAVFAVQAEDKSLVTVGAMVRLPINQVTEKALNASNCLTPKAEVNGLWVFKAGEVFASE